MRLLIGVAATMALFFVGSSPVFAHGGGLNSQGCHNNRKTGDYHCHRASPAPLPASDYQSKGSNTLDEKPAPSSQVYRNCAAARAAGAAPVRRGDPGYGSHLDRDNDGVGCE